MLCEALNDLRDESLPTPANSDVRTLTRHRLDLRDRKEAFVCGGIFGCDDRGTLRTVAAHELRRRADVE
jgi:hypothetical protein